MVLGDVARQDLPPGGWCANCYESPGCESTVELRAGGTSKVSYNMGGHVDGTFSTADNGPLKMTFDRQDGSTGAKRVKSRWSSNLLMIIRDL